LRLLGTLVVALLAITMAIFPISMPRAAVSAGHHHAQVAGAGHKHVHEHADVASHDDVLASASGDHEQGSNDCSGPVCCSMGTCHAFQDTVLPILYSPAVSHLPMAMPGDDQLGGITADGLDKPPRTV